MQLGYRSVSFDLHGNEYVALQGANDKFLALQGSVKYNKSRITRQFKSTQIFHDLAPNNILEGISLQSNNEFTSAVFAYQNVGEFKNFLSVVDPHVQYSNGKKLGRAIALLHQDTLTGPQKDKAEQRRDVIHSKLTNYLTKGPRFNHEAPILTAIIDRIDGLGDYKLTRRYGGLRLDNVFLTNTGNVVLKPSASYGFGDAIEDLVLFECEDAGQMPCVVAGVIDGYFGGVTVPANFWVGFAIYSAIYALTRCSEHARKSKNEQERMVAQSRRILQDFDNFTRPIPRWYRSNIVKKAKAEVKRLGI
ncbi:hypothetical protein MXE38_02480 [Anaerobiospirillum sp. NML120448]|uniref:hypothetical protein n=1 Tax=Anaerobiospirillum sp. NML120448 TaxID=2932816 RepID=UPI001FF36792|nr:hypothetical protein [Anaerobiospirillum sp. NML120448]MCK0513741.1 hypothetical protein [Anaerobiospirillum sp. NML120448]